MDMENTHTDLKVGDRVFCKINKMYGFVTRLSAFGIKKQETLGIQWDNKIRTIIFGHENCCNLIKQ
jgi:hypothetical protein